jgi:hypothetical protein
MFCFLGEGGGNGGNGNGGPVGRGGTRGRRQIQVDTTHTRPPNLNTKSGELGSVDTLCGFLLIIPRVILQFLILEQNL